MPVATMFTLSAAAAAAAVAVPTPPPPGKTGEGERLQKNLHKSCYVAQVICFWGGNKRLKSICPVAQFISVFSGPTKCTCHLTGWGKE